VSNLIFSKNCTQYITKKILVKEDSSPPPAYAGGLRAVNLDEIAEEEGDALKMRNIGFTMRYIKQQLERGE